MVNTMKNIEKMHLEGRMHLVSLVINVNKDRLYTEMARCTGNKIDPHTHTHHLLKYFENYTLNNTTIKLYFPSYDF